MKYTVPADLALGTYRITLTDSDGNVYGGDKIVVSDEAPAAEETLWEGEFNVTWDTPFNLLQTQFKDLVKAGDIVRVYVTGEGQGTMTTGSWNNILTGKGDPERDDIMINGSMSLEFTLTDFSMEIMNEQEGAIFCRERLYDYRNHKDCEEIIPYKAWLLIPFVNYQSKIIRHEKDSFFFIFMLGVLTSNAANSNDNDIEAMVEMLLNKMTLEEKVRLSYAQSKFSSPGVPRLGVTEVYTSDGPHGVRMEINWNNWDHAYWTNDSCTAFPALTCLAATWQPQLASLYGKMVGEEARYRNKTVLLGPGVNLYTAHPLTVATLNIWERIHISLRECACHIFKGFNQMVWHAA